MVYSPINVESTFYDDARQTSIFCFCPISYTLLPEKQSNYIRFDSPNPPFHFSRTHYSSIPTFHHSNRERSELIGVVAFNHAIGFDQRLGRNRRTKLGGFGAAGMESAAGRRIDGIGIFQPQMGFRQAQAGFRCQHRGQKRLGVWMTRFFKKFPGPGFFNDSTQIHHGNRAGNVLHNGQVVAGIGNSEVGMRKVKCRSLSV